ncbi:MAG: hypothetical protein C4539_10970 [Ignavibacteriales bacterium]|nr:MAG: hypothetical protein C4539_10970 [Ignavibacteriales bacterium]
MFEHRSKPLIPSEQFYKRIFLFFLLASSLIFTSLLIGILGYHFFEGLSLLDSLLNASMILGGMGPVNAVQTNAGKLFASFYALFSGLVLLVAVGVIFAPIFHRFLHKFHLDIGEEENK